jgi:hypothetical protein
MDNADRDTTEEGRKPMWESRQDEVGNKAVYALAKSI